MTEQALGMNVEKPTNVVRFYIIMDVDNQYVVHHDEDEVWNLYDETVGGSGMREMTTVELTMPAPQSRVVTGAVAAITGGELKMSIHA